MNVSITVCHVLYIQHTQNVCCSNVYATTFSEDDVRRKLKRVNVRKAAGPDGITGRVLRSCADQLAGLFTSIFNHRRSFTFLPGGAPTGRP